MSFDNNILNEINILSQKRKTDILDSEDRITISGISYYVSNNGNDENDGKSPATAWKTLKKVSEAVLKEEDGVLFKRGDLFRGSVKTCSGITYGAYGKGDKPKLYGWDQNLANPNLWTLYNSKYNIWKLNEKILDWGTLRKEGAPRVWLLYLN